MTFNLFILVILISLTGINCQNYVSDAELKTWSENLLTKDVNNVAKYISIQLQGKSKFNSTDDNAPLPLMVVDKKALQGPTISVLFSLFNNFIPETTVPEVVTNEEIGEQHRFVDAVTKTPLFAYTKELLRSKGLVPKTEREFNDFLYNLWFKLYSRGNRKLSSSAFEHIFIGEIKNGQVSGFHNWLFYNYLESQKKINYLGWVKKIDFPDQKGGVVKLHFTWGTHNKPVGSMFVGTSPELEMALYTICFLTRPNNKCQLSFGGKTFHIQTYTFSHNNNKIISSAYPNI